MPFLYSTADVDWTWISILIVINWLTRETGHGPNCSLPVKIKETNQKEMLFLTWFQPICNTAVTRETSSLI